MRRALVLLVVIASCDPQADSAYQGEPLVTLHGQVISSRPLPTPLEAAMLWQRGPPPSTDQEDLATRAPVQSGFPATFTVHLYQPPPAAARKTLAPGEVTYARANAAAIPYGIASAGVASLPAMANASYGIDANHWIVYLAADVPPRSLMEWWLGGALPAGFHLLRAAAVNPKCITPDQLQACVADLAQRGVTDNATAQSFCLEPYKLSLAPPGEQLVLDLGSVGLGPAGGTCP
jgi:hypothetical protein